MGKQNRRAYQLAGKTFFLSEEEKKILSLSVGQVRLLCCPKECAWLANDKAVPKTLVEYSIRVS